MIKYKVIFFVFLLSVFNKMTAKISFLINNKNKIIKGIIFNKPVDLSGDELDYPIVSVRVYSKEFIVEDTLEKKLYEKLNFFEAFSLYKQLVNKHVNLKGV